MKKVILIVLLLLGAGFVAIPRSFNVDKAVAHLDSHALSRSHNCCAWFVMRAMQAGGCPIGILPAHAYSKVLPLYGFKEIKTDKYQKGDIVVFPAVKGHKWGHIAMWNGRQWVSDFKQKGDHRKQCLPKGWTYKIYRYSDE